MEDTSLRRSWQNAYDFAGVEERCEQALELFAAEDVDVVLLVGDLAEDGGLRELRRVLRLGRSPSGGAAADRPAAPVLVVGGNHDGVGQLPRALRAEPGRARMIGARGRAVAGLRVAGLPVKRRREGRWGSAKRPRTGEWGRAPVLLASHFPVLGRADDVHAAGLKHPAGLLDRERVEGTLKRRRHPTIVVTGHMHVRDSATAGPVLQISCGAMIEPPFDATVVTVERHGCEVAVERSAHELGKARERRDPRMAPARQRWRFVPGRGWRARR